jgi:hypothetical protein
LKRRGTEGSYFSTVLISVKLRGKNEEDIPDKSRSLSPSAYSVPPCFKGFDVGFARFVFIRVDSWLNFICDDLRKSAAKRCCFFWLNAEC